VPIAERRAAPAIELDAKLPGPVKVIDTFIPVKAAGMAMLLSAINPKNLLLTVGGRAAIA
jgi:hypothetical protein